MQRKKTKKQRIEKIQRKKDSQMGREQGRQKNVGQGINKKQCKINI